MLTPMQLLASGNGDSRLGALAIGTDASPPNLAAFSFSAGTLTDLDVPLISFDSPGVAVAASGNRRFAAVGGNIGFKVFLCTSKTLREITDFDVLPNAVPSANCTGVSFSGDGGYVAFALSGERVCWVYKINGTSFTKLADLSPLPATGGISCAFSDDGIYLAVGSGSGDLFVYKRSGDTFTKLSDPPSLPSGVTRIGWSTGGTYLYAASISDQGVIYKRSGDTFTKVADLAPSFLSYDASFSADSVYLAVAVQNAPGDPIQVYKRSGDTFTKLSSLPDQVNNCLSVAFSADGNYLLCGSTPPSTSILTIYSRSGDTFTRLADPPSMPTDDARVCFRPPAVHGSR